MTSGEKANIQYKAGNYAEAIPLYRAAVETLPNDHHNWGQLVLALGKVNEHGEAAEVCKTALKIHTRSAWLWRQLGKELTEINSLDAAEKALDQSKRIDPEAEWLWRYYARLYKKQKKYGEEAKSLEELIELDIATGTDLNQIGIAYHNCKNYGRALTFYRKSSLMELGTAPYFNMGLVFNDDEVSQDVDAADAYRRALEIDPNYKKAQDKLASTKAQLAPLAEQALLQSKRVVRIEEHYQYYLNPFELLQLEGDSEGLDVKEIQRSKKKLLQELELNDGKVSWLDELPLGKSRVLSITEDLHDEDKKDYHWLVFQNKPLLRFLTHGDIRHFLYSDDYFPIDILDELDADEAFQKFLSKPFANQYNALLSRAMDQKALDVVEVLFDGRRWVEEADLDHCLSGAYKRVAHLVDVLNELENESVARLVGYPEIQNALNIHCIVGLFNLLPVQFRAQQTEVVSTLRTLAINAHNKHGETEISKNILQLCNLFQFKSHALNEKLKEDYKAIEGLLAEHVAANINSNPRPTEPTAPPAPQPSSKKEVDKETNRTGLWAAIVAILCVGGFVCNNLPDNNGGSYNRSVSSTPKMEQPLDVKRSSSEARFPYDVLSINGSDEEYWKQRRYASKDAPLTLAALGRMVKAKYPGLYDAIPDAELGLSIQKRFPGAYDEYEATELSSQNIPEKYTSEEILIALRNADAAGDSKAATKLAKAYRRAKVEEHDALRISDAADALEGDPFVEFGGREIKENLEDPFSEFGGTPTSRPKKPSFDPTKPYTVVLEKPTKLTQPIPDDSWDAVSYYNGEAPDCFNYTPKHDMQLDNQLRVTVGGGTDVVIKLMQLNTDRCIRYVYITSRSVYAIRNIPEGSYYLKIAYGKKWVEKKEAGMCLGKFASSPLYEKGTDILDFRTRSTGTTYERGEKFENFEIPSYEIKLDVVNTGSPRNSLNTDGISESEFNE